MNNWLIYAFLLGLGSRLQVQVIGYMPLTEIAILAITPFLLPQLTSWENRRVTRWLVPLAGVWALFVVISDVWNANDWSLFARGLARPIMYMVCIPFFTWFMKVDTRRRLVAFYLGMIPSVILSAYVLRGGVVAWRESTTGSDMINWETHWAAIPGLIATIAAILLYKRFSYLAYGLELTLGAFNVINGSRASGAVTMLGPAVCFSRNLIAKRVRRLTIRNLNPLRAFAVLLLVGLSIFACFKFYEQAVLSGYLADRHVKKFERQTSNRFGLLVGGRSEVVIGLLAIRRSPIIGYGSWARDDEGFYLEACNLLEIKPDLKAFRQGLSLLASHSHILQAWAQNGLGGGLFWAYVLWIIGLHLYRPMQSEDTLRLWGSTAAVALVWAVLFSPISERVAESLTLGVMLTQMLPRTVLAPGAINSVGRRQRCLPGPAVDARFPVSQGV